MIKLENLVKRYGSFTAVDGISLNVPKGSIFAFLGTNGAGKTTTIRMITGVLPPTSGKVVIGSYNVEANPIEAKSLMGVIPDRPHLYGRLTGREFLRFMSELYKVDRKKSEIRIDELLEMYNLTEWQHELTDTYSHGMKQRLMMCSAQIHNPEILIIDEPMVGLDPQAARLFKDNLRDCALRGQTIFMSTHSLSVAEEIADTLAIIQKGKILAHGSLGELYAKASQHSDDLEKVFLEIINDNKNNS